MKKNIYISLSVLLILGSCQELDLSPEDQLSDGSLWLNSEDYERGANILYRSFGSFKTDNDSDISYGTTNGTSNGNFPNATSNGTRIASVTSGFYNGTYSTIRHCNFLIDRALNNGFEDNRFVAEVRFFRAFHYFKLVQAYGDIPFYTTALDPASEALFDARTSRATVIDFILSDLADAVNNLPLESDIASSDKGRVAQGTAQALLARIALFEGTWAKYHNTGDEVISRLDVAINAAKLVIDSDEYALFEYAANPDESYRFFFHEEGNDSKEQMLARRYDFDQRHSHFSNSPSTKKLADMYTCTDGLPIDKSSLFQGRSTLVSEYENRDRRMWLTNVIPGSYTIDRLDIEGTGVDFPNSGDGGATDTYYRPYKWIAEKYLFGNGGNAYFYHELRYAEVLLTYAEALYEKNGSITDAQLNESINKTRDRAGVVGLTNTFVTANGLDMLTEIRRERTVELAHEGFRRHDLRRWKTAEIEMPQPLLGVQFAGSEFETVLLTDNDGNPVLDGNGNTQLRYPNPPEMDTSGNVIVEPATARSFDPTRDYLDPLPTEEIVNNPNLVQNPNW